MKFILYLLMLVCTHSLAQTPQQSISSAGQRNEMVSFTTRVRTNMATKDGAYMEGYVVVITYSELRKLHGKKVKVTGEMTLINGIPNEGAIRQGRKEDTLLILFPTFEVIGKKCLEK